MPKEQRQTEQIVDGTEILIEKLVETHGEEGVCPTAHSWRENSSSAIAALFTSSIF
jgi:hypothetical protein